MKWFRSRDDREADVPGHRVVLGIQSRFSHFLSLLERNNEVLRMMSDMEEKAQGEFLFDINYIRNGLAEIRTSVEELVDEMVFIGGEKYLPLRERCGAILDRIEQVVPGMRPLEEDEFIIPLSELNRDRAFCVGSKNAQMGELKTRAGMPVPHGFAISGWAYMRFLEANDLQARIHERISSVNFKAFAHLVEVSDEIQRWVNSATVPSELADAIREAAEALCQRSGARRFALRSSAIGEDTLFSFAGQYATFLNVPVDELVARYQQVIASKFTPQAIYYYLSHLLSESELAMSVGCVEMVDARAAGVVYTQCPVRPHKREVMISSVFGLGKFLVDGTLTPDVIEVDRQTLKIADAKPARKRVRLVLNGEGGTIQQDVPENEQRDLSISEAEAAMLADYAMRIEDHYGSPRDIEWAIDRDGQVFILQSRPLHLIEPTRAEGPDVSDLRRLMEGGVTVCPGAGAGPVYHAVSVYDLPSCPDGAVVVAPHTFPGLITVMGRASAILTETGGTANHMATVAREYRIPTVSGLKGAMALPADREVTLDASERVVYDGYQRELVNARRPEYELFSDMAILELLREVVGLISPLNLLHPTAENFTSESCETLHDVTRYCHQMAMEEMFTGGLDVESGEASSRQLQTDIPLKVNIIYIDQAYTPGKDPRQVPEDRIGSVPMQEFWRGVKHEGWPRLPKMLSRGMASMETASTSGREGFSETSFALLGKEYMILSLRMGYHFTTVEAMCTGEVRNNYIRMQYKEGGASPERRARRINLIMDVLSCVGFEHTSRGDFLDTSLAYQEAEIIRQRLFELGRLTMMTKQLDMALANDSIAEWYTKDYIKKLGLGPRGSA